MLNLPPELLQFLKENRQLEFDALQSECGSVKLLAPNQLVLRELFVDSEGTPLEADDPHQGEKGYYVVTAVDLIASCDGYEPDGILVWLPDLGCFGTWDSDHWSILIFPDVSWSEIALDPIKYVNAQWYPEKVDHELLKPWQAYPFTVGSPWD